MRTQRFGIEIEMTGITRAAAAQVVAGYFRTTAAHTGGTYDTYVIRDGERRQWKIVRDGSIRCEAQRGQNMGGEYAVEFVSPICRYPDIEVIQAVVRKLRAAGARVNDSCGIHIHVDASVHNVRTLRNIVNLMAAKEDLLYKALQVNVNRENYCQKADLRFLDELNRRRPESMVSCKNVRPGRERRAPMKSIPSAPGFSGWDSMGRNLRRPGYTC